MEKLTELCKIGWITLPAPDLGSAKTFYSEVFGFIISEYSDRFWVFKAANLSGGLDRDLVVNLAFRTLN
ncbi:MAG: VOC family protein [Limnochordia bacterium]